MKIHGYAKHALGGSFEHGENPPPDMTQMKAISFPNSNLRLITSKLLCSFLLLQQVLIPVRGACDPVSSDYELDYSLGSGSFTFDASDLYEYSGSGAGCTMTSISNIKNVVSGSCTNGASDTTILTWITSSGMNLVIDTSDSSLAGTTKEFCVRASNTNSGIISITFVCTPVALSTPQTVTITMGLGN